MTAKASRGGQRLEKPERELPTLANKKRVRIVSLYVTMAKTVEVIKPLKTLILIGV
jgi:hypothetical protein